MVTGPSFSATVTALCKGGKMPEQLLGKQPAASEGSKLLGNFRLRWVEERELHHVVPPSSGSPCRGNSGETLFVPVPTDATQHW